MKTLKYTCDIDGKECDIMEMSVFSGTLIKMTADLQKKQGVFEGHYCSKCTGDIITFIDKLKEHGKV